MEMRQLWRQLNRELHDLFHRTAHDPTLHGMASLLLRHIGKHPGISVSELSRRAYTAKSHVSNLVDQLVNEALVEKRQDAADQRVVRLYPTGAAEARLADAELRLQTAWQRVLEQIPEAERDDVSRHLHTLLQACRSANDHFDKEDGQGG